MKYVTFVDQCVVSKICDNVGVPWQTRDVGSNLDKALSNGKMSVRVTPENIAETLLCGKFDDNGNLDRGHGAYAQMVAKRQRIAQAWLDLSEGDVLPPWYYHLVAEFFDLLKSGHPSCITSMQIVTQKEAATRNNFTTRLNALATVQDHEEPARVAEYRRAKLSTMVLQSRYALDPDTFVAGLITSGGHVQPHSTGIQEALDALTLSQLEAEATKNAGKSRRLSKKARRDLQKHKKTVAERYALAELLDCLDVYFPAGAGLAQTVNFPAVRQHWLAIAKGTKAGMPRSLNSLAEDADDATRLACMNDIYRALQECLVVPRLSDYAVLNEIERCLGDGKMAGKGMMMDSLHIVALTWAELFITDDKKLEQVAQRGGREIRERSGKPRGPVIVDYRRPDQLADLLGV